MSKALLLMALIGQLLCSTVYGEGQYVISSSPSISKETGQKTFTHLAAVLSSATGKQFTYRHPGNWPRYIRNMRRSEYDLLFDESHVVSWRIEHLHHTPLLKLPGNVSYVIATRDNDETIVQLKDLAGYAVCTRSPPMLEGLILFAQFPDANRQPRPYQVDSPEDGFEKMLAGTCRGAILPAGLYEALAGKEERTRILFLSEPFPNWALSAAPAISGDMRDQITRSLLSPENAATVDEMMVQAGTGEKLLPASRDEYVGYDDLARDFWAFR